MSRSNAPWTPEQVDSLNRFQSTGAYHPFTCGPSSHTLVATADGWVCPEDDYRQTWAHDFMVDGSWWPGDEAAAQLFPFATPQRPAKPVDPAPRSPGP